MVYEGKVSWKSMAASPATMFELVLLRQEKAGLLRTISKVPIPMTDGAYLKAKEGLNTSRIQGDEAVKVSDKDQRGLVLFF